MMKQLEQCRTGDIYERRLRSGDPAPSGAADELHANGNAGPIVGVLNRCHPSPALPTCPDRLPELL